MRATNGRVLKCCGKRCDTPFCPHCGKAMRQPHLLDGLLEHCRRTIRHFRKHIERWSEPPDRHPDGSDSVTEHIKKVRDRYNNAAEKWQLWHDALAELIAREQSSALPPTEANLKS